MASPVSATVTARVCVTPPGPPSASAVDIVWMESTISRSGRSSSRCPTMAPRSDSAARYSSSRNAAVRSARSRTCPADSSPVTYNTRVAAFAATSSSSVDFPTPGSPASSTTAPGTRPPPSTRSSSDTPVGRARAVSSATSAMRRAGVAGAPAATRLRAGRAGAVSTSVPHVWHDGQRPTHWAVRCSQAVQR